MPDVRVLGLLALLSVPGCAHPLWLNPSGMADTGQSEQAAPESQEEVFRRQLDSLRDIDPEKYETAREVQRISDEVEPGPQRNMVDEQLRALVRHGAGDASGQSPQLGGSTASAPPDLPLPAAAVTQVSRQVDAAPAPTPPAPSPLQVPPPAAQRQLLAPVASAAPPSAVPQVPAAGASEVAPVSAELPVTREDWLDVLPTLIDSLELDPTTHGSAEIALQQQVYLRLLYMIANRRDDAVAPVEGLSDEDGEFFKHAIYSLMVWLDVDQRHASSRKAALSLRELRLAVNHLAAQSTLDVRNAAFCKEVTSYGVYEEFKPATFRAGARVVLYVEVENFVSEPLSGRFETELLGEYTIFDYRGQQVVNVVLPPDRQQCNNRRRDYFIAYVLTLPDDVGPGEYSLSLTIEDAKGKKSNQAKVDFRIR